MSRKAPILISILFSLLWGGFIADEVFSRIPWKKQGGYAALTLDASYPDRLIGELLPPDLTQGYLSESTQWVFLDDFGVLTRIPLDQYQDRLEDFDPRNDGYGEKLRSFFVREGTRWFFIPFTGPSLGSILPKWEHIPLSDPWLNKKWIRSFETALSSSLGSIPFSLEWFGSEQPLLLCFLLFIIASGGSLLLSDTPWFTAALLPILGALVFAGPAGLALGTALMGLAGILRGVLRPFWFPSLLGVITLGLWLGIFWDLPGAFSSPGEGVLGLADKHTLEGLCLPALSGVCGLLLLGFWAESGQSLLGSGNRKTSLGPMIPFALVSLMSLSLPTIPNFHPPGSAADPQYFLDPQEYERHVQFQGSFSFIPLGRDPLAYVQYRLGADGLIADTGVYAPGEPAEIPPFPLGDLIAFLRDFQYTQPQRSQIPVLVLMGLIPLLVVLGAYHYCRQPPGKKKKDPCIYQDKRIAA